LPFTKAAVDIHITSSFYSQSVGDSSYTDPITKHLQSAEQPGEISALLSTEALALPSNYLAQNLLMPPKASTHAIMMVKDVWKCPLKEVKKKKVALSTLKGEVPMLVVDISITLAPSDCFNH
jgi:hypothetical protein